MCVLFLSKIEWKLLSLVINTVNGKSDILSDILRSFHDDATSRHQESHELNELAAQHPHEGCQPSQNVQTCNPTKIAKIGG